MIVSSQSSPFGREETLELLRTTGQLIPDPLGERVDLAAYLQKLHDYGAVWLYVDAGKPVGMIAYYANDSKTRTAYVSWLGVAASHHGKGVGKTLLEHMHRDCTMKGMHRILLKVHPANKRAFRFYLRQGYSAVDVDQGKLLMQRDIPPPSPPCPTPIEKNGLLDRAGIDLHIKRDDTFPAYGGGSKARQISHILPAILSAGHRAIVTNGGLRSNHARATALACAEAGLPCRLVLHDEGRESSGANGNLLLMKMAGAQIECCRLNELAHRMDTAVSEWVEQGLNPFHLRGAGHCLEGSLAYHAAANEARAQCGEWIPDYVIHASGTGTIQAGLTAGYSGLPTKVIGISVAREKERGLKAVREALIQLGTYLGEDWSQSTLLFRDDWVMGGYEKTSEEVFSVIDEAGRNGLILDPTYTGKAWLGLTRLLAAGEIPPGSKVLFWHTGGVLNLLASPHYLAGKA